MSADQLPLPIHVARKVAQAPALRYPKRAVRPLSNRVLAGLERLNITVVSYGWLPRAGKAQDAVLLRLNNCATHDQKAPEVWYTRAEAADLVARLERASK